jgi:hypothetical protein
MGQTKSVHLELKELELIAVIAVGIRDYANTLYFVP